MVPGWVLLVVVIIWLATGVVAAVLATKHAKRIETHPHTDKDLARARAESAKLSRASRAGGEAEQVVPWLPGFPYAASDARFLGSPIDLVVFDGLSEGELREIVFVEVKTGNPRLSERERQVQAAVTALKVRHEVVRVSRDPTAPGPVARAVRSRSTLRGAIQLPLDAEQEQSDVPST